MRHTQIIVHTYMEIKKCFLGYGEGKVGEGQGQGVAGNEGWDGGPLNFFLSKEGGGGSACSNLSLQDVSVQS